MAPLRSRPARFVPRHLGGASGADEAGALLRARVPFFAKTIFLLFGAMFVVALALAQLFPDAVPPTMAAANGLAAVGLVGLGGAWFLANRLGSSEPLLRSLDALIMIAAGVMIGGGAFLSAQRLEHILVPFCFGGLLVFARVFIVPSSVARTLWLSSACMAPVTIGNMAVVALRPEIISMPIVPFVSGGVVLAVATVGLATLGTSVIYGLRREVSEARRFGQYTLDRKLGEGGMGIVYKAHHAMLRRPTALKLLPPEKAGAEDVARFEREVQLTSQLTHPNTIAIFDYGRSADGVFYYVMEYLDGIDLQSLVERYGPLAAPRAIRVLVQICEALDEAHQRGVVHRDIKPANAILCVRGQVPDFVKVVDFGLVKELAPAEDVTAVGACTGTPAYLAPEAVTGSEPVGPAADIYAVGAVGYFLVTGSHVFEGKTIVEILSHHIHTRPVPPSERADGVVAELERILLSCLAKAPGERPPSARAVADALSAIPDAARWSQSEAHAWWKAFESDPRREEPQDLAMADTLAISLTARAEVMEKAV